MDRPNSRLDATKATVLARARHLIEESSPVFGKAFGEFSTGEKGWPYRVQDGHRIDWTKFSFSTNSMIALAIIGAEGRHSRDSELLPSVQEGPEYGEYYRLPTQVCAKLRDVLTSFRHHAKNDTPVKSGTFGMDDPFTLCWLLEVLSAVETDDNLRTCQIDPAIVRDLRQWITPAFNRMLEWVNEDGHGVLRYPSSTMEETGHPLPLLRVVQVSRLLDRSEVYEKAAEEFSNALHVNLANRSIPDSIFDAAELVFALEGLVLCDRAPTEAVVDEVFRVLTETQDRSPYWRPLRPFVATKEGLALLPLSVEIANSLLRLCVHLRQYFPERDLFSDNIALFDRYFEWLQSRRSRVTVDGEVHHGWHSEHVLAANTIDLWETSQVLIFLSGYVRALRRHVAAATLEEVRLEKGVARARFSDWGEATVKLEPFANGPEEFQIFEGIGSNFVSPELVRRGSGGESILLFGPPGTGKTMFAHEFASALGLQIITITPSDFLAEGPSAVEARAKQIFAALVRQQGVVVLFDEIDRLILDRDSQLYREQGDVFQFMTPSMLVKLKDLYEHKPVKFIIATNYYERIDPAARRAGRIDTVVPLMPPNLERRGLILRKLLADRFGSLADDVDANSAAGDSALFTYGELKSAVDGIPLSGSAAEIQGELESRVANSAPMLRIDSYLNHRFRATYEPDGAYPAAQEPWDEFVRVLWLLHEAGKGLDERQKQQTVKILRGRTSELDDVPNPLREYLTGIGGKT